MESIKNYLDTMFRNLPPTSEVLKAKSELEQMMEDKYSELIREGKSENEAVGIVISEFGNLEELAAELGIEQIYKSNQTISRRKLTLEEVEEYLESVKKHSIMRSLGILLCICCSTGIIFTDALKISDIFGISSFFLILAAGIILLILSKTTMEEWDFLKQEPCSIDSTTLNFVKEKRREYTTTYAIMFSVGLLLLLTCSLPTIIFDRASISILSDSSSAFLFLFVGTGVFLITHSKTIYKSYDKIIQLNTNMNFEPLNEKKLEKYADPTMNTIMECYWPTVTCIYLSISFITFAWHITWIIWPIAGVAHKIIKSNFSENGDMN